MSASSVVTPEFLDANVVARYLVGDAPNLVARARALIESDRTLCISVVVLAEVGFLLTSYYRIDRSRAVAALVDLLNRSNIEAHEVPTELAVEALRLCAPSRRVSFADAMLWAVARHTDGATVWTFDRKFPADGIVVREPQQRKPQSSGGH